MVGRTVRMGADLEYVEEGWTRRSKKGVNVPAIDVSNRRARYYRIVLRVNRMVSGIMIFLVRFCSSLASTQTTSSVHPSTPHPPMSAYSAH